MVVYNCNSKAEAGGLRFSIKGEYVGRESEKTAFPLNIMFGFLRRQ